MCILSLALTIGTSLLTSLGISVGTGAAAGTAAVAAGTAATAAGVSTSGAIGAALTASVAPTAAGIFASTSMASTLGITTATTIGTSAALTAAGTTAAGVSTTLATGIGLGVLGVGALAVGSAAAGGVVSTVMSAQQTEYQASMAKQQAEMEERNAKLAAIRAEKIDMEANQKRASLLRESQQTLGTARTGYAASGVVLGSGTTLDYEADVADVFDLDMRNLEYDVKSQQWQQRVAATNSANQAALYRAQAKGYESSKTGTILSGAWKTTMDTIGSAIKVGSAIKSFA